MNKLQKTPNKNAVGKIYTSAAIVSKFVKHPKRTTRYVRLKRNSKKKLNKGTTGTYYISKRLQNIAVYGITRSGKGEMLIKPMIDINSRASLKHNIMCTDPKGENASSNYLKLKRRGFHVHVLNLLNIMHSAGYNPLSAVVKPASLGDIETASNVCKELAATIYDKTGKQSNQFFYTSAANLFTAIVFSTIANAHGNYYALNHPELSYDKKEDKSAYEKVTMYNILQFVSKLGGKDASKLNKETTNQLNIYFEHLEQTVQELRNKNQIRRLDDIESDHLKLLNQAVISFSQTKLASSDTAGSIYSTFTDGLDIYQQPEIAKMTSCNSFNPLTMGFDHLLTLQFDRGFAQQELTVTTYEATVDGNGQLVQGDKIESIKTQLNSVGVAELPLAESIPTDFFFIDAHIHNEKIQAHQDFNWKIQGHKTFYNINDYNTMRLNNDQKPLTNDMEVLKDDTGKEVIISKYTKEPMFKKMNLKIIEEPHRNSFSKERIGDDDLNFLADKKRNLHSLKPESLSFLYDESPTALFLVTPPDKTIYNQLATFFINQTINTLSSYALRNTKNRQLQRPLQVILDELGNFPKIPDLDKKISFGLSQKIAFMLIFQDREQGVNLYGREASDTILSNCATTNYILSKSQKTAEEISKAVGKRTVETQTANQDAKLTNLVGFKNVNGYHNGRMAQEILPVTRLQQLKEGEMVTVRATDRKDNYGQDVAPLPIFNTGKTILPYSWKFLNDEDMALNDIPMITPHKYLSLEDTLFDYNSIYQGMEATKLMDMSNLSNYQSSIKDKISNLNIDDESKGTLYSKVGTIIDDALDNTNDISINTAIPNLQKLEKQLDNDSYKQLEKLTKVTKGMFDSIKGKQGKALQILSKIHDNKDNFDGLLDYTNDSRYAFDNNYKEIINNESLSPSEYYKKISTLLYSMNLNMEDYNADQSGAILLINQSIRKFFVNNNVLQSNVKIVDDGMGNESKQVEITLTKLGKYLLDNYKELSNEYSNYFHDLIDPNLPEVDPNLMAQYILEVVGLYTVGMKSENGKLIKMDNIFDNEDIKDTNANSFLLGYDIFLVLGNRDLMTRFINQNSSQNNINFTTYFTYITGVLDRFITFAKHKSNGIDNNDINNIQSSENFNVMISELNHINNLLHAE